MLQQKKSSLSDLRTIATDIKDTMSAIITDLHHDIQAIADRVQNVEKKAAHQGLVICRMIQAVDTHTLQLCNLHHHMEDLDNGRHLNLRVEAYLNQLTRSRYYPQW